MPFNDTAALAIAWLDQPQLGARPQQTFLVGAAVLLVRERFRRLSFDLRCHSTVAGEDQADTVRWLADALGSGSRLLLWRAEDIAVPALIAAAETTEETVAGAKLLRSLDRAFTGEVVDVAETYGGTRAVSFDAVAHEYNVPFVPLTPVDLAEAYRIGRHGTIRDHLAARAIATWRLWALEQPEADALAAATTAWLAARQEQA